MVTDVTRLEDMSSVGRLHLMLDGDSDVIISILPQSNFNKELVDFGSNIEFCTIGSGGGGSPRTYKALRDLMTAMEEDNADSNYQERAFSES